MASQVDPIETIIERIRQARNFDFRNYKRATLQRRVERRMTDRRCRNVREYLELLDHSPDELNALVSSMFIKVTSFFRDPEAWTALERHLDELLARKAAGDELRAWSVGCATGEEAYSIAMILAERLGPALSSFRVKVFGTDVDESAVAHARRGVYGPNQVAGLSKERLARFFTPVPDGWAVQKDLRRLVVFGVNNLVGDAPISRLDVLSCRNVFIYLDAALQKRILSRFHYGLRRGGLLLLGKSELIPFAARLFECIDLSRRLYRRRLDGDGVLAAEGLAGLVEQEDVTRAIEQSRDELAGLGRHHRQMLDAVGTPVIATTPDGVVTTWNAAAAALWGRSEAQVVGKKLGALALPGLAAELLAEKSVAVRDGRAPRRASEGTIPGAGDAPPRVLSVEVSALREPGGAVAGLVYATTDVTPLRRLEEELQRARAERQAAIDEVQAANEELQSSNEELETTNEELQSANEELQTTNEELQSTNEELETTNEELQSTNAELDATNRELAHRTEELNLLGFYQRTIIRSLSAAVVVLDGQGRITLWNLASERLLGVTEAEALGQLLWTLRVPILGRDVVKAMRRSLSKGMAWRAEDLSYERAGGGRGHVAASAIPLVEEGRELGAVVLLEDTTRAAGLAEERLRSEARRNGRTSARETPE